MFSTVNANDPATSVAWTRVDPGTNDPNRFVSAIYVDPANARHAWISCNGYNISMPTRPGHVFEVTWSGSGTET